MISQKSMLRTVGQCLETCTRTILAKFQINPMYTFREISDTVFENVVSSNSPLKFWNTIFQLQSAQFCILSVSMPCQLIHTNLFSH